MSRHRETNPHLLPEDQQIQLLPHGREPPFSSQPPRRHQKRQPRRSPTPYPHSQEHPQVLPHHDPHYPIHHQPHELDIPHADPRRDPHYPVHHQPHELDTPHADPRRDPHYPVHHQPHDLATPIADPLPHEWDTPTADPRPGRHPHKVPAPKKDSHPRRHPHEVSAPILNSRPHRHPHHSRPPSSIKMPKGQKTRAHTWLIGVCCALFWVAVILTGLVVLIVYIVFRPRSPKFDIAGASLNSAYLDMGYLLNADINLLVNFTNPSKKATVDFSNIVVNVHFGKTLIATTYVEPFAAMKAESSFRNVHMVSSQVRLPVSEIVQLKQQATQKNRVRLEVKAFLKTRSNLGKLFRYTYMLYGYCSIEVTGPPSGVLMAKTCRTKR